MKRVLILVEGQTEEAFVKHVLAPHLSSFGKWPEATCICTRRVQGRRAFRGGIGSYEQVRKDVRRLLQSKPDAVTTLIDYYALPSDFPGYDDELGKLTCFERVHMIEDAFGKNIGDLRFTPNLVVHEFEGLLFSSPEMIAQVLNEMPLAQKFIEIATSFASPEEINDSLETAPSKRIEALCPRYEKPLHGPMIASNIGLDMIRQRCKHFNEWLLRLEAL